MSEGSVLQQAVASAVRKKRSEFAFENVTQRQFTNIMKRDFLRSLGMTFCRNISDLQCLENYSSASQSPSSASGEAFSCPALYPWASARGGYFRRVYDWSHSLEGIRSLN